jgi:hypothetical protein
MVARLMREGLSRDEILIRLRSEGYSIIDSIRGLVEGSGMSLGAAKEAVHLDPAWADQREQNEAFHEMVERAFDGDMP